MNMLNTIICWHCKNEVEVPDKITRQTLCPECDNPLKCCFNCRFYDKDSYHQCTEPQAEWVRYKEKANFCEYFQPRLTFLIKKEEKSMNTPEDRKKAWDDLFDN